MNITTARPYVQAQLIRHIAISNEVLSNQAIYDQAIKHNDSGLFNKLVDSECVKITVDPLTKNKVYQVKPGSRFYFLFVKTFKKEIERDRENCCSVKACIKRDMVKFDSYNTKLVVYDGKLKFENALDEIYFISHEPPSQRRSEAQKKTFERENKPKNPRYEFGVKAKPHRSIISRPANATHLQRLESAFEILNKQYRLLCHLPYYASMTVELEGQHILLSDIIFNHNHPQFQFTRLKHVLLNSPEAVQKPIDASLEGLQDTANECEVVELLEENNEEECAHLRKKCKELNHTRKDVLTEFSIDQRCVKTHQTIRDFNEKVAIQLFRRIYLSKPKSYAGSMHESVVYNQIRLFSQIETYACENSDYFPSKTREILREYKIAFDTIRYSPLFMRFDLKPNGDLFVQATATFSQTAEAEIYSQWYQERCPKYRTDKEFIEMFSSLYAERMNSAVLDKTKKWIREGQIFSYKQLTYMAALKPKSEVANILNSLLATRLQLVKCHEQEVNDLTIQSQPYIETEDQTNRSIKEKTYFIFHPRRETYTPPKRGQRDGISLMQLQSESRRQKPRITNMENRLYEFYMTSVVAQ